MKGENKIKTMLIMAVIISTVITGTLGLVGTLANQYGKSPNTDSLEHSIEISQEIEETYELFEEEENVQSTWLGDTIITGGKIIWGFITLIIRTPGLAGDLVHDIGENLGVPPLFLAGASLLLLITGIFAIMEILGS